MSAEQQQIKLVITMEGGIIQAITANSEAALKLGIVILDFDTVGADDAEIVTLKGGQECIGRIDSAYIDPEMVDDAFKAVETYEKTLMDEVPGHD